MEIRQSLEQLRQRIQLAEQASNREAGAVQLIAVSKQQTVEAIQQAYQGGQRLFGESYLQEALDKIPLLAKDIEWHFIGRIQSNKTRQIAENFHWIHGICSVKQAQRLSQHNPHPQAINIFIQVNIDADENKAGVRTDELKALALAISELPNLTLRGLMTIPKNRDDAAASRDSFRQLASLQAKLKEETGLKLDCLSMGMSRDFESAIAEGATHVRVGSALFGQRQP